jgi:ribosomal protein S18 acetylase RimI-like enzyme
MQLWPSPGVCLYNWAMFATLLEFQPVVPQVATQVHQLYQHCPAYFHLIGMEIPTRSDVEREVEASLHDPKRNCSLIFSGDRVVGYLDYKVDHPESWAATISLLLIDEQLQGQGLGGQALAFLERRLRNIHHLYAVVYGNNPVASRFWERQGFRYLRDGGPSLRWYLKELA